MIVGHVQSCNHLCSYAHTQQSTCHLHSWHGLRVQEDQWIMPVWGDCPARCHFQCLFKTPLSSNQVRRPFCSYFCSFQFLAILAMPWWLSTIYVVWHQQTFILFRFSTLPKWFPLALRFTRACSGQQESDGRTVSRSTTVFRGHWIIKSVKWFSIVCVHRRAKMISVLTNRSIAVLFLAWQEKVFVHGHHARPLTIPHTMHVEDL